MARLETETKTYITWLPFLIDSGRWKSQGWRISEKERISPKWKVLAPLSFVFPILRVTYERSVAGGMLPPEAFRLASWLSNDPSYTNDPRYAAFFASTLGAPVPLQPPLPPYSSAAKVDPSSEGPVQPDSVPMDFTGSETQEE
jgi:hypothetical protein